MNLSRENLRKVGKIKGSHGIKGEVFLLIFSKDSTWVSTQIQIHLTDNEKDFKAYTLNRVKPHKEGVIAVLDGISSRNESDLLIGQEIWVDPSVFVSKNQQSLYLVEIEGFEIIDAKAGSVGFIQGFSSNTAQDLLLVKGKNAEFEIPFVKEFIIKINHSEKIIYADLPDGLLEINSNSDSPDDGAADEN
ncbi:MAG: 16S rRNA processing protein RimM [Moraxellaceae bacterium]|nr:16S rRNA processing protein RimM [Pseudobdellovibrionaceae bacterium]